MMFARRPFLFRVFFIAALCVFGCSGLPSGPKQGSAQGRPLLAQTLIDDLYLGLDPLAEVGGCVAEGAGVSLDESMTHVSARDIDVVLQLAPEPLTFWVELGSYEGGSAILAAKRIQARALRDAADPVTTVLAVDPFVQLSWRDTPAQRARLLRPDGTSRLYGYFCANVRRESVTDLVLPLAATSLGALRLIAELAQSGSKSIPQPQVIYLDSAHEEGEVLLELRLAWDVLAPGGVIFGDDWILPAGRGSDRRPLGPQDPHGGVQRDVLRFAKERQSQLDDSLGKAAQGQGDFSGRTLGRPRHGLFVSYLSFQWFMRKRSDGLQALDQHVTQDGADASFDCWSGGFGQGDCCDEGRYGPDGNPMCWDIVFTFEQCCGRGRKRNDSSVLTQV